MSQSCLFTSKLILPFAPAIAMMSISCLLCAFDGYRGLAFVTTTLPGYSHNHTRLAFVNTNISGALPPDSHLQDFVTWAKNFAAEKEVLIIYASHGYEIRAHNCILSLWRQGVFNAGVITVDQEAELYFSHHGIHVFNIAKIRDGIPVDVQLNNTIVPKNINLARLTHKAWASRWNNHMLPEMQRWAHWMLRHYLALAILKDGYGVFQVDADMVFLDDPYKWLDPEADLEGQTQPWPMPNAINFGIGHVASSLGGVLHWETTNLLMRYSGADPQSAENIVLMQPLFAQVGTLSTVPCRSDMPNVSCELRKSPMLTIRRWPDSILPMGGDVVTPGLQASMSKQRGTMGIHVQTRARQGPLVAENVYIKWCKAHGFFLVPANDK